MRDVDFRREIIFFLFPGVHTNDAYGPLVFWNSRNESKKVPEKWTAST
jgi:hypothetical protein